MKLETPVNMNYAARVIKVTGLRKADNSDNLQVIPSLGMQAIVDLQTLDGELGIIIPAGSRLSDKFLHENNLYRHAEKNKDSSKVGYIEDDRRLKAITLRGNRSDALYLPIHCLLPFLKPGDFRGDGVEEGMVFDHLNGELIVEKYEKPYRVPRGMTVAKSKVKSKVDEKFFPQQGHVTNYFYVDRNIKGDPFVVITQKLHGTNIRIGHVPVKTSRLPTWFETFKYLLLRKKPVLEREEWRMVYGSHHVVKDANNPDQQHFYDHDLWTENGKQLDGLLPKGFVVYGELVGFTESGSPIQSHYTYDCAPRESKLYVYRVTQVSSDGIAVDLSWPAVQEFCKNLGLNAVPELFAGRLSEVHVDDYLDINFAEKFGSVPVALSKDSPCDEGVVIRIEGIHPEIYKAKSPKFVQHESKMYEDDTSIDMEAEEEAESSEVQE